MDTATTFEHYRPLLFSIAYRMLGTAMDAEDMVQETWLRFRDLDLSTIESPRAYLTTIVTRLCINQLNSARLERETYIGPWLPEPVLTDGAALLAGPAGKLSHTDSISMAFLILLESLSPSERAVFLLREVFDYEYREIAAILEKSEPACRQLYSRAKKNVAANRPRFETKPETHDRLVQQFLAAVQGGDVDRLAAMLAEDVVVWTDGGGKVVAALQPVRGRENAARFVLGSRRLVVEPFTAGIEAVNGRSALVLRGQATGSAFLVVDVMTMDDRVIAIHVVGNPDKLRQLQ